MKLKKIFILLLASLFLFNGCNGSKKEALKWRLLEQLYESCEDCYSLDIPHEFLADFYRAERDKSESLLKWKTLTTEYLMEYPNDKEVKSIYDILNAPFDVQVKLDNFMKVYKNSIFLDYVRYLNVIGINNSECKFYLIPDYENESDDPYIVYRYLRAKFIRLMYQKELYEIMRQDIYRRENKNSWALTPYTKESFDVSLKIYDDLEKFSSYLDKYFSDSYDPNLVTIFGNPLDSSEYRSIKKCEAYIEVVGGLYCSKELADYENNLQTLDAINRFKSIKYNLRYDLFDEEEKLLRNETLKLRKE